MPLASGPTRCSSFRLLTLPSRYRVLSGSDCINRRLREATGAKRGDTVGLLGGVNDLKPLGKDRPNIALLGGGPRFDQFKELERLGSIGLASRRRKEVERGHKRIARLKQV